MKGHPRFWGLQSKLGKRTASRIVWRGGESGVGRAERCEATARPPGIPMALFRGLLGPPSVDTLSQLFDHVWV